MTLTKYNLNKYGLTENVLLDLKDEQHNSCAICGISFSVETPSVDHDHKTNKVRGLLCNNCNVGLGMFRDNVRLLAAAIVYLEDHEVAQAKRKPETLARLHID